MKSSRFLFTAAFLGAAATSPAQSLEFLTQTSVPTGAEILSFSKDENTVASTVGSAGVQLFTLNADGSLTARGGVLSYAAEFSSALGAVSSVALDPLGRGFGVASLIPTANGTTAGRVAFFNYRAGSVASIVTLDVGFHPDNVSFSRDGKKVFVANEGEFTTGGATDAPGSVSVIDLSGVTNLASVATLTNANVNTIDFQAANLATGVTLDALRFNDNSAGAIANRFRHVEPEYITEGDGKIYVTLQENNAIAELSLTGANANKWTAIHPLGTITQTIDASDKDGAGGTALALVDDVVKGMPMPDTMASFTAGGTRFLVTANEGDFRVDDGDRIRVKDFTGVEAGVTIDRTDAAFGRLRVLKDVSDPDGDGLLDEPVMPGTRSFSIWNATTGALVKDSGSLEPLLLTLDPTRHNINAESGSAVLDARSPDKGPEPEAIATGDINGHRYLFVGLERQDGLLMFDATNPAEPTHVAYVNNFTDGLIAPECILFIKGADNPTGEALLLVGYEISGTIGAYKVTGAPAKAEPATPVPPTLGLKKKLAVDEAEDTARVKGRASADTVRVLVNGKRARGTTKWRLTVKFPLGKDKLRLRVVAYAADGTASAPSFITLHRR
jgi:DNA-binding beta-propeller fold protein YncE